MKVLHLSLHFMSICPTYKYLQSVINMPDLYVIKMLVHELCLNCLGVCSVNLLTCGKTCLVFASIHHDHANPLFQSKRDIFSLLYFI